MKQKLLIALFVVECIATIYVAILSGTIWLFLTMSLIPAEDSLFNLSTGSIFKDCLLGINIFIQFVFPIVILWQITTITFKYIFTRTISQKDKKNLLIATIPTVVVWIIFWFQCWWAKLSQLIHN